jgi:UDP-N-acetylmuramoyl-tripeptide--D-alanyl-D-alanine ligase
VPAAIVPDTVAAVGRFAVAYTEGLGAVRIAVTGSVGKTTTKEFTACALSSEKVYSSKGNYNSVIGMPLSLAGMPAGARFGVFECGMERQGQMPAISRVCRPHVAAITNIGTSHLEFFGSREGIAEGKLAVADCLDADGVLLLPAGEPLLAERLRSDPRARSFSGDGSTAADYAAADIRREGDSLVFDLVHPGGTLPGIAIPTVARHNVPAAVIACAVALVCGISPDGIRAGLASYAGVGMRQQELKMGGCTVIADCYNASPESMRAAADLLCGEGGTSAGARVGGKRIAVLGDMYELGPDSDRYHFEVGRYFARAGTDVLIAFGPSAGFIASGASTLMEPRSVLRFPDPDDPGAAARALRDVMVPGDRVIVKASRRLRAERIIEILGKLLPESV